MGRVGYVPSLLCAEFVMGRVCHVPSLLCAELSLNPCYQYVAGLGLELAILGSTVRLTVDCARESGLQKCGLFLRPLAKMRMHFLHVSHLMTNPTK